MNRLEKGYITNELKEIKNEATKGVKSSMEMEERCWQARIFNLIEQRVDALIEMIRSC